MTVTTPVYGSPEWQAERAHYIGASDVPMILGISPFGTSHKLWAQKKGLLPREEGEQLEMGHYLEPAVFARFADGHPEFQLQKVGTVPHEKYPWLRATPDRLIIAKNGKMVGEAKTKHPNASKEGWGEPGTDEVPDHVIAQTQVQLMCLQLHVAWVPVLLGYDYYEYIVEASRDVQEMILDATHDWYQRHLRGDEEPEVTGAHVESYLRRKYQSHSDVMIEADPATAELMQRYFDACAAEKKAEAWKQSLRPQLMTAIGNNRGLTAPCGKIVWSESQGREYVDTKGLLAHLQPPESLIQQYTHRGAPVRSFRPYPKKEK